MPNWCCNSGHVRLPKNALPDAKEIFTKLAENKNEKGWFENVFPTPPEHSENWYEWNLEHWGTKWDVNSTIWDVNEESFSFSFESAWGPPEAFFDELADRYGIEYELSYHESGCRIAGICSYLNGKSEQKHVEGDDYPLFVIKNFDEPIESVIYELEQYQSFDEFIAVESSYSDNPELLELIKQYYIQNAEPQKSTKPDYSNDPDILELIQGFESSKPEKKAVPVAPKKSLTKKKTAAKKKVSKKIK